MFVLIVLVNNINSISSLSQFKKKEKKRKLYRASDTLTLPCALSVEMKQWVKISIWKLKVITGIQTTILLWKEQWWSTIPPTSTKRTITLTPNKRPCTRLDDRNPEPWDRHKIVVGSNRLMESQTPILKIGSPSAILI